MSLDCKDGTSRKLRYEESLRHDLKLLEISDELLEDLKENRIVFKGCENEDAVLCTSKNTYLVREVETTNLVMLVEEPTPCKDNEASQEPGHCNDGSNVTSYIGRSTQQALLEHGCSDDAVSVTALVKSHLELSQIKPRLDKLDVMLRTEHIIKDVVTKNGENDGHEFPPGETWDTLVESIQASNKEISEALQELDAVRIDGRWMGVSQETYSSFVKLVLLTAAEQGWSLEKIPCVEMAIELEKNGVCGQLTLQLLHKISIINQANVSIEDLDRQDWREMPSVLPAYSLKADVVCRNIAIGLLLEKNNWEDKNDFLGTWKSLLPDHFTPTMDMLQGECLEMNSESLGEHGKKATKTGVMKLSARELPRDPSERFRRLFNVQREWTYSAVQPYICNLTGPGQTVEELLLKYARPCQTHPADEVTYTAR